MKKSFTSLLISLLLCFVGFFAVTVQADDSPHFVNTGSCRNQIQIAYINAAVFTVMARLTLSATNITLPSAAPEPLTHFSVAALHTGVIPNTQGNPLGTNYGTPQHQLLG